MPSESSAIVPDQIRKARETASFSLRDVATLLGVTIDVVASWESGQTEPSVSQLETLAKALGREIEYFVIATPDSPTKFVFRHPPRIQQDRLSPESRLAIARFEELCRKADQLDQMLDIVRRPTVPVVEGGSAERAAGRQRDFLGYDARPVKGLREKLTSFGIRAFQLPAPSDEFSGLSSPNSSFGPRILVNANDGFGRRHFTLAHEFAHLLFRDSASVCHIVEAAGELNRGIEQRADLFAVEFLMPAEPVSRDAEVRLEGKITLVNLARFAARWQVSAQAMGYRLERLGLLRRGTTDDLLASGTLPSFPVRKRRPKWLRQLGTDYVDKSVLAYRRGHVSVGRLASLLGVSYRTAFELVHGDSPL